MYLGTNSVWMIRSHKNMCQSRWLASIGVRPFQLDFVGVRKVWRDHPRLCSVRQRTDDDVDDDDDDDRTQSVRIFINSRFIPGTEMYGWMVYSYYCS